MVWTILFALSHAVLIPLRLYIVRLCPDLSQTTTVYECLVSIQSLTNTKQYTFTRLFRTFNAVWMCIGVVWYYQRTDCDASPLLRYVFAMTIFFWLVVALTSMQLVLWGILMFMLRVFPNHPVIVRLRGVSGADVVAGMNQRDIVRLPQEQFHAGAIPAEDAVYAGEGRG